MNDYILGNSERTTPLSVRQSSLTVDKSGKNQAIFPTFASAWTLYKQFNAPYAHQLYGPHQDFPQRRLHPRHGQSGRHLLFWNREAPDSAQYRR